MPANKKYLSNPLQRSLKITAGFIGGYILTEAFHMLLAVYWNVPDAILTLRFAGFILWAVLMVLAFLSKNGWKIWGSYLLITVVLIAITYCRQPLFI
tara:strand:- start:1557 stop:1847 length:291 start_codon:yes stop_codon:yes gene_type:complete